LLRSNQGPPTQHLASFFPAKGRQPFLRCFSNPASFLMSPFGLLGNSTGLPCVLGGSGFGFEICSSRVLPSSFAWFSSVVNLQDPYAFSASDTERPGLISTSSIGGLS